MFGTTGLPMASHSPPAIYRSEDLAVDGGDCARLVVIADTHSEPHARARELIAQIAPHAILHAGDIGASSGIDPFRSIAPVFVVRGNIDGRSAAYPDHLDLSVRWGDASVGRIFLTHNALRGPRLIAGSFRDAKARGADLVVCGHSHVPFIGSDRGLGIFNPGSIGPRRFVLPITFGVLEMRPTSLTPWHVSCETGERWAPPGL